MAPARLLAVALLLGAGLGASGCLDAVQDWGDPLARSTFAAAGSNATAWQLEIAGDFRLAPGTAVWLVVNGTENGTCQTGRLAADTAASCQAPNGTETHVVTPQDLDQDGRLGKGDRLIVTEVGGQPLNGTYRFTLGLHKEVPIFVLTQRFDGGPAGRMDIEVV